MEDLFDLMSGKNVKPVEKIDILEERIGRIIKIVKDLKEEREALHKKVIVLKEELEEKQKEILDSIRYARRIQNGMMPNEKNLHSHLKRLRSVF